jgi:hypothetical protein
MRAMKAMSEQILLFVNSIYNTYLKEYGLSKIDYEFNEYTSSEVLTEDGKFIFPRLKDMINSIHYQHHKSTINIKGIEVHIDIFRPLNNNVDVDVDNEHVNKIMQIIGIVSYLCKTINTSFNDKIKIKIVLSPFKKTISNNKGPLTAYNVNSGYTVRDYYEGVSTIVIFREEEVIKVLIHELLHSFDIDSKTLSESYDRKFMKLFNKETRINLNESFTDSFACLLNVCLATIYYSKKHKTSLKDTFVKFLEHEREYILSVGEKVGRINLSNRREQTNITAYYVLKAINWMNIEDFSQYIISNRYMIGKYRDYAEYLGSKLEYNKSRIIKLQLSDKNNKYVNNENNKSIRMSSIDIFNI